jgi:hypothetical protein
MAASTIDAEAEAARLGATLSVAKPLWPASRPVVGLVTFSMSSAVNHQA